MNAKNCELTDGLETTPPHSPSKRKASVDISPVPKRRGFESLKVAQEFLKEIHSCKTEDFSEVAEILVGKDITEQDVAAILIQVKDLSFIRVIEHEGSPTKHSIQSSIQVHGLDGPIKRVMLYGDPFKRKIRIVKVPTLKYENMKR